MGQRCDECRFWVWDRRPAPDPQTYDGAYGMPHVRRGTCRGGLPTPRGAVPALELLYTHYPLRPSLPLVTAEEAGRGVWPWTEAGEWCGAWQAKPAEG